MRDWARGSPVNTFVFPTADQHLHQPQSGAEASGAGTRAEVSVLIRVAGGVFTYPRVVRVRSCRGLAAVGLLLLAAPDTCFCS